MRFLSTSIGVLLGLSVYALFLLSLSDSVAVRENVFAYPER